MSEFIKVDALGDACPLPVVKTLKALKQLDGEGAVVTSVDNETAVKNISKMAQEKGCTASVEKISDAEWHVTVATSGAVAVAVADPEQDGATFCDANAGKGKLVISVYTDCMGRGDDELGHKLMKAFIFAVTQQEELPATMLFYNGGARLTCEGSASLEDLKNLAASLAADWGIGLRVDLNFLILRLDMGMKVYDPSLDTARWRSPSQWLKKDGYSLHFGVGYPF